MSTGDYKVWVDLAVARCDCGESLDMKVNDGEADMHSKHVFKKKLFHSCCLKIRKREE